MNNTNNIIDNVVRDPISDEIRRIILEQIPKEDLEKSVTIALRNLTDRTIMAKANDGYYTKISEVESMIRNEIMKKVLERANELLESDEYKLKMQSLAEETFDEIQKKTKEKMVENISNKLSGFGVNDPANDIRYMLQQLIMPQH